MTDRIVKVILRGDVSGLTASMAAASKSVISVADQMTAADAKSKKFRQGLTTMGATAGKVGLVAAGGLALITKASADFAEKMALVQTLSHANAGQMKELSAAAMEAGKNIGYTATEVADGEAEMVKAGVSLTDILGGGLKGALDLAAAGQTSVADATSIAAQAMTQFQLKGKDIPHVADLLAAGADKALGSVQDLGMALTQAGTTAHQAGVSINDTVGVLAAFAQAGLTGERGGTTFKQMLIRLEAPSKKAADLMKQYGLSLYDASGQMKTMPEIAGNLQTAMENLDPATRNAALATIFGSRAVQGANIMYQEGAKGIADWISKVNDQGFAAQQAAGKMNSLKGDLSKLKASFQNFAIDLGNSGQGPLRQFVQELTHIVDAADKMPGPLKQAAVEMAAVTAVLGGGLWFTAKTVTGIANMRRALDQIAPAGSKAAAALRGVGTAAATLTVLWTVGQAIKSLQDASLGSVPGVQALTHSLLNLSDARVSDNLAKNLGDIGDAVDRIADPNLRQRAFDWMHNSGREVSALASGVEYLTAKTTDFGSGVSLSMGKAKQEIAALDDAFANIVTSGSPEQARVAFANLAKSQGLSAAQQKTLLAQMPQYKEALLGAANSAKLAGDATGQSTAAEGANTRSVQQNTKALQDNIDAMQKKRSAVLAALNAEIGYQQSLDDARSALAKNGKTLDITTQKGRDNKTALLNVAAAWNQESTAAKNAPGAHKAAIRSFVDLATSMGMGQKAAERLARRIIEIPSKDVKVNVDTGQANSAVANLAAHIAALHSKDVTVRVNEIHNSSFGPGAKAMVTRASGGYITGPGTATSDSIPAWLSNGEYVIKAAAVEKYGTHMFDRLNAMAFASGGLVGRYASGGPVVGADHLAIAKLTAEIGKLRDQLAKTGKAAVSGHDRRLKEVELKQKQQEIAQKRHDARQKVLDALQQKAQGLRGAISGFHPQTDLPGYVVRNPTLQAIGGDLASFRKAVTDAGGEWTKRLQHMAAALRKEALSIDVHERALTRETTLRDKLTETLGQQQQAMDSLRQTMSAFSDSVAGNFTGLPFGQSQTVTTPGSVDPRLQANLSAAQARLAAIRNSPTADSVGAAAEASRLIPQIAAMAAEVERQAQPVERTVSGYELLTEQLKENTAHALDFAESLKTLTAEGLNKDFFAQLASSGDYGMASAIVAGGQSAVDELNALYQQNTEAAASVAAYATQQVYGQQQAILQAQIDHQNALIKNADANIRALNGEIKTLGNRVEKGAEAGVASLQGQLAAIQSAISSIPRQQAEQQKKARR